jgi:hypothetical protein
MVIKYKSVMIEYLIILKLIMKKKNIFFSNNFYVEWLEYLLPYMKIKLYNINNKIYNINNQIYSNIYTFNDFLMKYNIKYFIKNIIKKSYFNNFNVNINIICDLNHYFIKNIINIKINFIQKFYIFNLSVYEFEFSIPIDEIDNLYKFKNKNINFYEFDKFMINIWNNNQGILMYNYMFSSLIKKIIYFDLFKKIVLRLLSNNYTDQKEKMREITFGNFS